MAKKTWLVTLVPPKGGTPKLSIRAGDTGSKRTALRNYTLQADSRGDAQSLVEAQERAIAEQNETDPWVVDTVKSL